MTWPRWVSQAFFGAAAELLYYSPHVKVRAVSLVSAHKLQGVIDLFVLL